MLPFEYMHWAKALSVLLLDTVPLICTACRANAATGNGAAACSDSGPTSAADRRAEARPQHCAQSRRADRTCVGILRLTGHRSLGELLAGGLVVGERLE